MSTPSRVPGAGTAASSHAVPSLVGIFLFGPDGRKLRAQIRDRVPWLDQSTGSSILLQMLGDPRSSGRGFWEVMRSMDVTTETLVGEWDSVVEKYGSDDAAENFETHDAAQGFQLEPHELPILIFPADGLAVEQWPRLRLPRDYEMKEGGAALAADLIRRELSDHAGKEILSTRNVGGGDGVAEAFRDHLSRLQANMDRLRCVLGHGLDPTDEAILNYLRKKDVRHVTRKIAAALNRDPKSIGKNLARLRAKGLIDNHQGKHDRGYRITPSGLSLPPAVGR